MTNATEIISRLETELKDYYDKLSSSFGAALTLRATLSNEDTDYYTFGVRISLTPPHERIVPLAYHEFYYDQDTQPILTYIINTLNEDLNQRIKDAHLIAKSCPEQVDDAK